MKKFIIILIAFIFPCLAFAQTTNDDANFITLEQLIGELESIAKNTLEPSEALQKEFVTLQKTHGISGDEKNYRDFVRVRLAFEATRDSGLWQIQWAITDKEPNSDSIWNQWNKIAEPQYKTEKIAAPTAIAECDELSALFAFIARKLGVKKVGLFWPTWNHTVGVWTSQDSHGEPVRIVIPTSQVFISANASLGTKQFAPYKQKVIYDYERQDVPLNQKIPKALAEMMLNQVRSFGDKPASYLQDRRNRLSNKFGGS